MFKITGRADHVSREQVRSFLYASAAVLGYHNLTPKRVPLKVSIRRRIVFRGRDDWDGLHCGGLIDLRADLTPEAMLTTCLHEVVHAFIDFPEGTLEKCTSTLTARLKADVARMARVLLDGTYRRAAYIAHTKLSYRAAGPDHYDDAQHEPVGVATKYQRGG